MENRANAMKSLKENDGLLPEPCKGGVDVKDCNAILMRISEEGRSLQNVEKTHVLVLAERLNTSFQ